MRVTDGMRYNDIARNLSKLNSQFAEASQQASSGIRLDRPSQDPIAAAELARVSASLGSATSRRQTVAAVRGDAELAESSLAGGSEIMTRAREVAMQGANGSLGADERSVLAKEVRGLKDELVRIGNTRGSKGYIFAGTRSNVPAFDANGAFQGDDVAQLVDLGGSSPTAVNSSGARAFTVAGGRDAFADLEALASALEANDVSATAGTLNGLELTQKQLTTERARTGMIVKRLETSDGVLEQLEFDLGKRQSDVAAADPYQAYSRMTALSQALERSVAVSRQILDTTNIQRF